MRGSQVNRSLREKSRVEPQYSNFNRDPFGTLRAARGSRGSTSIQSSSNNDVFLDSESVTEERVVEKTGEKVDEKDYRGVGEIVDPQLAATDELLGIYSILILFFLLL